MTELALEGRISDMVTEDGQLGRNLPNLLCGAILSFY